MKYLAEPNILILNRDLACAIGVNAALALRQLSQATPDYKFPEDTDEFSDDYPWTSCTYEDWCYSAFPFWEETTVEETFGELEALGLVLTTTRFTPTDSIDIVRSYAVNYDTFEAFMALWNDDELYEKLGSLSHTYDDFLECWRTNPQYLAAKELQKEYNASADPLSAYR